MDPLLACCSKKSSLKVVPEYPSCPGCSLSRVHPTWNHARRISLCVALSSSVVSSLPLVILLCLNNAYPWIGVDFLILYSIFIRSAEYFLKFLFEESDYNLRPFRLIKYKRSWFFPSIFKAADELFTSAEVFHIFSSESNKTGHFKLFERLS